jgi:hypothetical protein
MDYCWNWMIAYAFRIGAIDREEFIRQWENIQKLSELMSDD